MGSEMSTAAFVLFWQLTWGKMLALTQRSLNVSGLGMGAGHAGSHGPSQKSHLGPQSLSFDGRLSQGLTPNWLTSWLPPSHPRTFSPTDVL